MSANYDLIGINYAQLRKPDHRIAKIIASALGPAQTVLNVGAGAGSYEPTDRSLIAVEPSREMIRKRSPMAAEAIQASANDLPFDDKRLRRYDKQHPTTWDFRCRLKSSSSNAFVPALSA